MKTLKLGILCLIVIPLTLGLGNAHDGKQKRARWADVECLAKNIYHESRNQPLEGQIAVAQVTLNRVASKQFQSTVCAVVYAPSQFSWTLDKRKRVRDQKAWQASISIARAVLTQSVKIPKFPALYFHTTQVNPKWNRSKKVLAKIGDHVFYS